MVEYYHITIKAYLNGKSVELFERNMDSEELELVVDAYNANKNFVFDGKWINYDIIEEIRVYETLRLDDNYDNVFSSAFEVTREWIKKPPKLGLPKQKEKVQRVSSKKIFIVHGRDHEPMKELKAMLLEFGLNPIVLHEQPSGSRTIIEKLEKYSDVGYAFVILTPDDVGGHSKDRRILRFEGKERARQNVVLEFGYFIAKLGRDKVCCLLKGDVEKPSDMQGIVYVPFKDSVNERRNMIIKELKAAGYEIKN